MAEETSAAPAQPQIRMSVLAQFVRDMSFENMVAQKGLTAGEVQPDIQVAVSLDARKRSADHQYEVITKYKVTSKNKGNGDMLFLLELEYGGIFHVEGVPEEQLHPFLLIECPRLLFPFCRRIISAPEKGENAFSPLCRSITCSMSAVIDPPSRCVDLAGTIDFDWHGKKFVLEILLFGVLLPAVIRHGMRCCRSLQVLAKALGACVKVPARPRWAWRKPARSLPGRAIRWFRWISRCRR